MVIGRGSAVGTPLVEHPGVLAISFTGSVPVGEGIREAAGRWASAPARARRQNPLIVMADADLGRAAEAAYAGAFWSAGRSDGDAADLHRGRRLRRVPRSVPRRVESGPSATPPTPRPRSGRSSTRARWTTCSARSSAVAPRAAAWRRAARAPTPTPTSWRRPSSRTSPTTRCSPARRYRPGHVARPLRRARRGHRASQRGRVRALGGAVHAVAAGHAAVRRAGGGGHPPRDLRDRRRRRPRPVRRRQGSGFGPHEQGRAAREFYTEVVTVYQA